MFIFLQNKKISDNLYTPKFKSHPLLSTHLWQTANTGSRVLVQCWKPVHTQKKWNNQQSRMSSVDHMLAKCLDSSPKTQQDT